MAQEFSARTIVSTGSAIGNRKSTLSSASSIIGPSADQFEEKEEDITPDKEFAPITHTKSSGLERVSTNEHLTQEELRTVLSRRRTNVSGVSDAENNAEQAEIERLMSRMFGKDRHNNSEEEKTRHVGVVFKNLNVKGVGLGAALQPTIGDIFLGLPRKIGALFNRNKKVGRGPPVRTILNNFSGVIRPGEMLLVLGRPGSGCSTFLKVLGNQRAGFKTVEGEVTYGGLTAEQMAKDYRGEVLYNPEDDLHYATLSVQRTLEFALKTRTPAKESRLEGETRSQYVSEFLKSVTQLCK
jgi:ATP-binding cassette subfamily G (WHITE) protein 2 (SNQ2)